MEFVPAAICEIKMAVAELAIPSILWCSAIQYREYPNCSQFLARSRLFLNESDGIFPERTGTRSRTENGMDRFEAEAEEYSIIMQDIPGHYVPEMSCKIKSLDFIYGFSYNLSVTIEAGLFD